MTDIHLLKFNHFAPRQRERYPATTNGLFWVRKGKLSFNHDDGRAHELSEGEFMFYNSTELKEAHSISGEEGFEAIAIVLSIELLNHFRTMLRMKNSYDEPRAFCKFDQTNQRLDQLKNLLVEMVDNQEVNHVTQYHLAITLLSAMVDVNPLVQYEISYATQLSASQKIIQYIEDNINEDISLDSLANFMGMSIATLKRRLSAEGMSFSQLLKIKRVTYAATQLRVSRKSITEIAYESGFKSAAHFSTAFKAVHNITPKEFRNRVMS